MRLPPTVRKYSSRTSVCVTRGYTSSMRQIRIRRDERERRGKDLGRLHADSEHAVDDSRCVVESVEDRVTPAGGRIGFERQIRVLHRTVDTAIERHAEDVRKAEVIPALSEFVEERGREGREQASTALDVASDCVALGVRQRRRVGEDEQPELVEAVRGQEGFVHELEWHARFDERVVHAEHVILGAVALRHAGVVRVVCG